MTGLDALRCAKILVDRHGKRADVVAALRADELGAAGDEAGRQAWLQVLAAVDELARTTLHRGEVLH